MIQKCSQSLKEKKTIFFNPWDYLAQTDQTTENLLDDIESVLIWSMWKPNKNAKPPMLSDHMLYQTSCPIDSSLQFLL